MVEVFHSHLLFYIILKQQQKRQNESLLLPSLAHFSLGKQMVQYCHYQVRSEIKWEKYKMYFRQT